MLLKRFYDTPLAQAQVNLVERLGIGGWSYGGILTNALVARDPRFRAAITESICRLFSARASAAVVPVVTTPTLNEARSGMRRLRPSDDRLSRALFGPSGVSGTDAGVCASTELPIKARKVNATNFVITASFEPEA